MTGLRLVAPTAILLALGCVLFFGSGHAARADGSDLAEVAKQVEKLRTEIDEKLRKAEQLARDGKFKEAFDLIRELQTTTIPRFEALLKQIPGHRVPTKSAPKADKAGTTGKAEKADEADAPLRVLSEKPVTNALRWLAAHQSPNGGWEATGFNQWCDGKPVRFASKRPDGLGKALYDPGVTGLALLAFLRAGYTYRGKHPFAETVRRGLRYLTQIQDRWGCFGPRTNQQYVYSHAIAALAMVTAYGQTGAPLFRGSAQRGLDFVLLARNPYFAWRYGVKPGDNDTSVSGWMYSVVKAAERFNRETLKSSDARLRIEEKADDKIDDAMRAWLTKVTDPDYGQVGYVQRGTGPSRPQDLVDRFPGDKVESMTAVGVLSRIWMGEDPRKSKIIKLGVEAICKRLPTWNKADGSIDMYYWYYATQALRKVGSKKHWRLWRSAVHRAVIETQRMDTDPCQYKGSWDPVGPWGLDGGRVYSTAMMAMILTDYFEFDAVPVR